MPISIASPPSCRARPTPRTPRFVAPIRRRRCGSPAWAVTEMLPYRIIALAILAASVSANAQTVTVQSGRYTDFRQLLVREALTDSAAIAMTLRLPDQAQDRYPAIVIVHSIGGYLEANEGWHADEFRKAGFATLTYRSDAARRL